MKKETNSFGLEDMQKDGAKRKSVKAERKGEWGDAWDGKKERREGGREGEESVKVWEERRNNV